MLSGYVFYTPATAEISIALGRFDDARDTLNISKSSHLGYDVQAAVLQFQHICESLYYIFLFAYRHGGLVDITIDWKIGFTIFYSIIRVLLIPLYFYHRCAFCIKTCNPRPIFHNFSLAVMQT